MFDYDGNKNTVCFPKNINTKMRKGLLFLGWKWDFCGEEEKTRKQFSSIFLFRYNFFLISGLYNIETWVDRYILRRLYYCKHKHKQLRFYYKILHKKMIEENWKRDEENEKILYSQESSEVNSIVKSKAKRRRKRLRNTWVG